MGKYSADEIRAFRIKDIFQARMSALKAASMNNEGKGKKPATIKKEADEYYDWLMQEQDPIPEKVEEKETADEPKAEPENKVDKPESDTDVLPKPATADENRVLKIIFKKVGANSQKKKEVTARKVLEWAKETHGVTRYPSMESSVETIVTYIKGDK